MKKIVTWPLNGRHLPGIDNRILATANSLVNLGKPIEDVRIWLKKRTQFFHTNSFTLCVNLSALSRQFPDDSFYA